MSQSQQWVEQLQPVSSTEATSTTKTNSMIFFIERYLLSYCVKQKPGG
jgi:hypothetical protein